MTSGDSSTASDTSPPRAPVQQHEFIPGTVHLVDLEGTMHARHAEGTGRRDIVLVPTPSDDPDDPLNWAPRRKLLSTTCMSV